VNECHVGPWLEVYRDMKNYFDGHTKTAIGNSLHPIYEKYFLDYEKRHLEAG